MTSLVACLAWSAQAAPAKPVAPPDYISLSVNVVNETNALRANPKAYAAYVRERKTWLKDKVLTYPKSNLRVTTKEGATPIDETVAALNTAAPMSALTLNDALGKAARDHAADQGKSGGAGHTGSDGSKPSKRIARYGKATKTHENISYGPYFMHKNPARELILDLLIDDGVADRGHRKTLLQPDLKLTGIACGPHPKMKVMCVMTYAATVK
jgi:uncharacterized protein YkwD